MRVFIQVSAKNFRTSGYPSTTENMLGLEHHNHASVQKWGVRGKRNGPHDRLILYIGYTGSV